MYVLCTIAVHKVYNFSPIVVLLHSCMGITFSKVLSKKNLSFFLNVPKYFRFFFPHFILFYLKSEKKLENFEPKTELSPLFTHPVYIYRDTKIKCTVRNYTCTII